MRRCLEILAHSGLKLANALAEASHQFWYFLAPEQNQRDQYDQSNIHWAIEDQQRNMMHLSELHILPAF